MGSTQSLTNYQWHFSQNQNKTVSSLQETTEDPKQPKQTRERKTELEKLGSQTSDYYKATTIQSFIAALFTTARTWKQLNCPSAEEWIRKVAHIYVLHIYRCIYVAHIYNGILLSYKKNKARPFEATRMDTEAVILNEVRQTQKDKYMLSLVWNLKKEYT